MPEPRPERLDELTTNELDSITFDWKGPLKGNSIRAGSPKCASEPGGIQFGTPTISGAHVRVDINCDVAGEYRLYNHITVDETGQKLECSPGVRIKVVEAGSY